MPFLTEKAVTSLDQAAAFEQVADLGNIHRWDPGVVESDKVTPEPMGVGTTYALSLRYGARDVSMLYVVTEYEPNELIVYEGSGGMVKAIDTIRFVPHVNGTEVIYEADLRLTGLARLAQPFMRSKFATIGQSAGDGLRSWLRELERASGSRPS